jgi:hypothetical protein
MIHLVVMKCLIGLPLLIHIEILRRSQSRKFCVPTLHPWVMQGGDVLHGGIMFRNRLLVNLIFYLLIERLFLQLSHCCVCISLTALFFSSRRPVC